MFDANGVICTDIHKASLELLSAEEILKTSACKITSTIIFDADGPRKGGLHDPAMGSLDQRIPCATCGCRRDCPGHLGHIELPLPLFHPTLLPNLIRLMKTLCLRCRRLRIDPRTASVFVKKFQLIQYDMLAELEQFTLLHGKAMKERQQQMRAPVKTTVDANNNMIGSGNDSAVNSTVAKRVQLIKLFTKLQQKEAERKTDGKSLATDISENHTSVETWTSLRKDFFKAAMAKPSCAHCVKAFRVSLKQGANSTCIEMSWPWGSEKPFSSATWRTVDGQSEFPGGGDSDLDDDGETDVKHGRRGRAVNTTTFYAYQVVNLIQALWSSPDKELLEFLYPISIKQGWEMFFLRYLPVSANKFRPLMKAGFGGGGGPDVAGGGALHNRTAALLDTLGVCEKMSFALSVLRNPDPLGALNDKELPHDPSGMPLPNITDADKQRLTRLITQHLGNFKLLRTYCRSLQEFVNVYIDSTKAGRTRARVPPGVRQWMEKKQGAIRQKMMGKRVNFAARTVIAPDNLINTNEIGIPEEFAKKLTIAEYVTPITVRYLRKLVENGAKQYPGANSIQDSDGAIYDLSRLSDTQRRAKARLLSGTQTNAAGGAPKIVYRHVRDGDVVIMNRQPTLHRASMMAHFVKVLRGWRTFRMMYSNCGSYNADFDGDEMNMHLPQDPCSRAEAQLIVNADCHYITAKDGTPLRGLIQDHVLGGAFLTCRNTFLDINAYYTLIHVGVNVFVEREARFRLSTGLGMRQRAALGVAFSLGSSNAVITGDPYFNILPSTNLRIVVEPPTVCKPQRLWTGKQVINSILKSLLDTIIRNQNSKQNPCFSKFYKGFNFEGKSKTSGDSWGGVLDGDKEESTIIIRDSELLQGVLDKSMFGASSHGLVHLIFELMGPRAAGIFLSVFARVFTTFLQLRGFSCCVGDFIMTPEGERSRDQMIARCSTAGSFLQEVFVDSVNRTMKWPDTMGHDTGLDLKLKRVSSTVQKLSSPEEPTERGEKLVHTLIARAEKSRKLDTVTSLNGTTCSNDDEEPPRIVRINSVPESYAIDYSRASSNAFLDAALTDADKTDVDSWKSRKFVSETKSDQHKGKAVETSSEAGGVDQSPTDVSKKIKIEPERLIEKKQQSLVNFSTIVDLLKDQDANPWDLVRRLAAPLPLPDWRHGDSEKAVQTAESLVERLITFGRENRRHQRAILELLSFVGASELPIQFPRVAKLLGSDFLWGTATQSGTDISKRLCKGAFPEPPLPPEGRVGLPRPNVMTVLPSGKTVLGDGAMRLPVIYHPSWVFRYTDQNCSATAPTTTDSMKAAVVGKQIPFEDTTRYVAKMAEIKSQRDLRQLEEGVMGTGPKPCHLWPNEVTRSRLEALARSHFAGREDALNRMFDGFFQSGMGKLTSRNNELVSGRVTLYKFPFNGFSSMITTGAKGSKVNFAMICGMLSQQSLEGKRVPVMVSGKTLPSFARFDFGARAGGLITDRYLTGLRPQEYFFHCMAGREGLVDTAVKTARSGYLQRCVMKGMEGIMVHYDGTVRDSDGTVIQFLYGEDAVDSAKASFSSKLEDLMQNPLIVEAKYNSFQKRTNAAVQEARKTIRAAADEQEEWKKTKAKELSDQQRTLSDLYDVFGDEFNDYLHPADPLTNRYSPHGFVSCVSEKYRKTVEKTVAQTLPKYVKATEEYIAALHSQNAHPKKSKKKAPSAQDIQAAHQRLEDLLLTRYAETLCAPGEGVGCLSAQSMGEPATQMTLNTFHLAGHGAANVTLGIPRLREILQTAGKAQTPYLYLPIKGETQGEAARNAEMVLLGFKRIPLTDVIHSIGVESNVYHQPRGAKKGLPELGLSIYEDNVDQALAPKFFWQYEILIQFENLDHFCKVVPKFTPQKIVALTVSRACRDMMRQVNRLMYLYAFKFAEEEMDSEDDELEDAMTRFVFERDIRSHFTRRDMRKERARTAGVGFGTRQGDAGGGGEMDLLTSVDVAEIYKRKPEAAKGDGDGEGGNAGKEGAEGEAEEEKDQNSDAMPDSDHSKDDSEEDFSESDMGEDAQKDDKEEEEEETAVDEVNKKVEGEASEESSEGSEEEKSPKKGDKKEKKTPQNASIAAKRLERQAERRRLRALASKFRDINLEYDKVMRILKSEKLILPTAEELEEDAMWSDTEVNAWKVKPFPDEAFRFLTDVKICRKSWKLVLKFGWPMERCPRRVSFLDTFVKTLRKYTLQDTFGVRNPRIVGGDSSETGAMYEVQCAGSNFGWVQRLKESCVDHYRVTSNDIRAILQTFGVEACRCTIIRELNKVFSVYGILVDYRHMSLIADAMTHSGFFRSFSRLGIAHHSSPFLQMSFETSMKFLTEAIERGAIDDLRTPAGSIVTGKPALVGSGMCRVLPVIKFGQKKYDLKNKRQVKKEKGAEPSAEKSKPPLQKEKRHRHTIKQEEDAPSTKKRKGHRHKTPQFVF